MKSEQSRTENARSVTKNVRSNVSVQTRTASVQQPSIRQRSAVISSEAPTQRAKTVSARIPTSNTLTSTVSRSAISRRTNIKPTTTRAATSHRKTKIARVAELDIEKIDNIKSKDYSKCKTVYFECMDEFCANKDTTLRRCACSSRTHDFDDIKKQLSTAEEKMIGFNQRLLTVGMDKEDALVINSATEGEIAFGKTDSSESEKILQKITQTLNESNDSKISNNLSAISLDLDMESAWDSVDSLSGIATTAKSGLELYNATLPVCLEMAREVCSDDELNVAENSYKLAIQQDCSTVAKAYNSKYNDTIGKIHESGALLDMARLNAYQQRNSDDILTCKRKILEKLSDSAVCGEKLYRCLDITGQYIDQSDGSAFLSANLFNITTLLTAPESTDIKWSKVPNNKEFVTFLNSKKEFLESATEQCQDIADTVWSDFLEDALAQIKLAQNAKLEEVKRSCTKLVSECKTNALASIEDFDTNAISTFRVMANTTANTMCADIQNACIALIDNSIGGTDTTWSSGITGLEADALYESIIENCTAIGQTCIMQKCNGTTGNFALCEDPDSYVRHSILKRDACWSEVEDCVAQAKNFEHISVPPYSFNTNYKPCATDDKQCLITHAIWGDCNINVSAEGDLINKNFSNSLLTWLAQNTNQYACSYSSCPVNHVPFKQASYFNNLLEANICKTCSPKVIPVDGTGQTDDNHAIQVNKEGSENLYNYCPGGCRQKDKFGNCCKQHVNNRICVPATIENLQYIIYTAIKVQTVQCNGTNRYYCPGDNPGKKIDLYCVTKKPDVYPKVADDGSIDCGDGNIGYWVLVDEYGNYFNPAVLYDSSSNYNPIYNEGDYWNNYKAYPVMNFKNQANAIVEIQYKGISDPLLPRKDWVPYGPEAMGPAAEINSDINKFMITYPN